MTDYYVRLVELPLRIKGVTVPNTDGSFDIYINSRLSQAQRDETLEHELQHVGKDHFYSLRSTSALEREAEGGADPVLQPPPGLIPCFHSEDALARWLRESMVK